MRNIIFMGTVLIAFNSNALLADSEAINLDSSEAKVNYSVGYQVGGDFKRQKIEMEEAAFIQGIRDALADKTPALTQHEMRTTLVGLKKKVMEQQRKDSLELAKVNIEKGQAYLAANEKKKGVTVLPSGLQYRIMSEGKGKSPKSDDQVSVHYKGSLIDGSVFDSSFNRGKPAEFKANQVIKGWSEALQLMKEGSKWELVIPPELAYGTSGAGRKIPPNSTLIFEVELLSIAKRQESETVN